MNTANHVSHIGSPFPPRNEGIGEGGRGVRETPSPYKTRCRAYLDAVTAHAADGGREPADGIFQLIPLEVFRLIPRLETGGTAEVGDLQAALARIEARRDCADFVLAGLLRILYRPTASRGLTDEARAAIERAMLGWCYWYDQIGPDGRGIAGMCFHTENHQILFHVCEILGGQLFPETVFANSGKTGAWHIAEGTQRALRWMDERARFGFAEWLSCYFDEDLLALMTLYDFARDPELRCRAKSLIDLILLEVALHQFRGVVGTTRGRTYAEFIQGGRRDPNTALCWLAFGVGEWAPPADPAEPFEPTLALTCLATSDYRVPAIVDAIAHDAPPEMTLRERHGVGWQEAEGKWGYDLDNPSDSLLFWACQTSRQPRLRPTAFRLAEEARDEWLTRFIGDADARLPESRALVEGPGGTWDGDAINTALAPVDLVTLKTPDYLLSCAQDFRPGRPGYQQHVWQATLGLDAVVFTTQPGSENQSSDHVERPNFWAGNRWLPRAAQHRNVVVCLHHAPPDDRLPWSHAYFPRAAFDEVTQTLAKEGGNWTIGRKGDGYIALYSRRAARWNGETELRADAPDNVWICEMGSASRWGDFTAFVSAIAAAPVAGDGLDVVYTSPSLGEVRFGWTGPLTVAGQDVPLHDYPRFDNPYVQAPFGETVYGIRRGEQHAEWDLR